jgi:hypothetical protein
VGWPAPGCKRRCNDAITAYRDSRLDLDRQITGRCLLFGHPITNLRSSCDLPHEVYCRRPYKIQVCLSSKGSIKVVAKAADLPC